MLNKTLITLTAVTALAISSTAMAKGGGGSHGGIHGGMFMHGHGHFDHRFVNRRFDRNLFNRFNGNQAGWGWGGDCGWGGGCGWYNDNGGGNSTVIVFPQAKPQAADVTGSIAADPCRFTADTFNVPSAAGGTRAVQVVACR